jgi:hypothetical protein
MDALAEGLTYTRADFLDWKESSVSIVAEGDYVAARLTSGGTQARDFEAIPHIEPAIPNKHRPRAHLQGHRDPLFIFYFLDVPACILNQCQCSPS